MRQKYGGRQKGTPNKKTVALQEIAERLDVDPFEILLLYAKGDFITLGLCGVTSSERLKAAIEAASYLHPKRKAIEHTGEMGVNGAITVTVKRIGANAKPKP